ncbi:TPA: hypothetical protein ACH3X1_006825 [Trebouxia sp. C0004]
MSDADSAGSHGRASKAPRSAGGHVARVRQQFEAVLRLRQGLRFQRRKCQQPKMLRKLLGESARPDSSP